MFSKFTSIYSHDFTTVKLSSSLLKYLTANLLIFPIPFLINQPQLLVGSLVNFCLIYIALHFKKSELLPSIFLPSIAAVLNGLLLGSITSFLVVLMPFIWLANAVLIFALRRLQILQKPLTVSLLFAGMLKVIMLYGCTFVLVKILNLPSVLLITMGSMQIATLSIAAFAYLLIEKLSKNKF